MCFTNLQFSLKSIEIHQSLLPVVGQEETCVERTVRCQKVTTQCTYVYVDKESNYKPSTVPSVGLSFALASRRDRTSLADTKNTRSLHVVSLATFKPFTRKSEANLRCWDFTFSTISLSVSDSDISQRLFRMKMFGLDSRSLTRWKNFFSYNVCTCTHRDVKCVHV